MPELPEVETIKNDLTKSIVGKNIAQAEVLEKRSVRNDTDLFVSALKNNQILDIERKGKFLFFKLRRKNKYLLAHLRMTGQLIYAPKRKEAKIEKYSRALIYFSDGSALIYNDIRAFGFLQIISEKEEVEIKNKLGIDPLSSDFTLQNFQSAVSGRKGTLKSILLDQKTIAGIGNIYADEICFEARVYPGRKSDTLSDREIRLLHRATLKILRKSIRHRGTTFSNYVDGYGRKGEFINFLKVYGRGKKKCLGCSGTVETKKIAGRTTHYCPSCQK